MNISWLRNSYKDIISAVDAFFEPRDPSPATPMEVYRSQGGLCKKLNFGHIP